ncbi:hypothetical protein [Streptomyces endocoffeicus]|uniref:hypothetical protein n=1 Tax=Streptomyces endocoffeicus TaxID=2898945 RepID=UPI003557BB54
MDTADFPRELELRANNVDGQWVGSLSTEHRSVALADIKAIYWNRPSLFRFPELSESDAHWARGAARIGLGGVLMSLAARWMNHPSRASRSRHQPMCSTECADTWLDWPSPTLRWTSSCGRMVGGRFWRRTPRASGHGSTVRKSP